MAIYSAILVPASTPNATSGKLKFLGAEGKGTARKLFLKRYPGYIPTNITRYPRSQS